MPRENDCFALPAGVDWLPVDDTLARLREKIMPSMDKEQIDVADAIGRVLAQAAIARAAHPPFANAAVDGYGFAHQINPPTYLQLTPGRAAAGHPFAGDLAEGRALRIFTGAPLPKGVDTILLQEEAELAGERLLYPTHLKKGANSRAKGEDLKNGQELLTKGHKMRATDLAVLASGGVTEVTVYRKLRIGLLSTGDEIGNEARMGGVADANQPMLKALLAGWGFELVAAAHVADDANALAAQLDMLCEDCDAIISTGGASAGEEDHVSKLLREKGELIAWRIAVKPGRPLAVGRYREMLHFGLPGNPVAAFVCALIFVYPALMQLQGRGWLEPMGYAVEAAFTKSKKAGRREFLRARLGQDGRAEIFHSEGSGRVSGLSWADGLVELPDAACIIAPGDKIRFLPFTNWGVGV